MKRLLLSAVMAVALSAPVMADNNGNGGSVDVRGRFGTFSATGLLSTLPTNSNGFSAGVANEGFAGVMRNRDGFQANSGNQTTTFGNGWSNANGGLAGGGFAGVRGNFTSFGRR